MKDKLIDILQERFNGHEANVDPGAWSAISGKLAHAASGEGLRETLQKKFNGHEAHVDPSAWANIQGQLGTGAAGGTGIGAGWMAAGIAGIALIVGLIYLTQTSAPAITTPPAAKTIEPKTIVALPVTQEPVIAPIAKAPEVPKPIGHHTTSSGERVVENVLQQLVAKNQADPQPASDETVPAPTPKELPDPHLAVNQPANTNSVNTQQTNVGTNTTTNTAPTEKGRATSAPNTADEESMKPAVDFVQAPELTIYIPNVFSPNGDGINDKLEVKGEHYQNGKVLVRIFSAKNSTLVFSTDNLETSWDGHDMRGALCEEGYYFYAIEVTGEDGQAYSKGETVRLFRN